MRQTWLATLKVLREPFFALVVCVLLLAALTLNGAAQFLQLHFKKLPVDLAHKLDTIPQEMGSWKCVYKQEQINPELAEALGTDNFVFRTYVNAAIISDLDIRALNEEGRSQKEKDRLVGSLRAKHPDCVVDLAVTYYTGKADTVAHIPERCYVSGGSEPIDDTATETWDVPTKRNPSGKTGALEVRSVSFEDQTGVSQVIKNVCYFFHANGNYVSNPYEVRMKLQDLRERYAYYLKVELMTMEKDRAKSTQVMVDFLRSALPEIEKTYPDWKALHAQRH